MHKRYSMKLLDITKINNMQRHSNSYKRTVKRMTAFLLVVIVVLCAAGCKSTKEEEK
mgnify:CR=1 FL=1